MRRPRTVIVVVVAFLAVGWHAFQRFNPVPGGPTTVVLDVNTQFQTIDGWSVYPRYWEDDKKEDRFDRSFEPYVEEVSQFLVNEVGINAVRIEIWSGLENPKDHWIDHYEGRDGYRKYARYRYEKINDNDDPYSVDPDGFQFSKFDHRIETMTLPIKQALEAKGESLHVNVTYVDFRSKGAIQGTLSHADHPEEFAEFVLVFFRRLKEKYGIEPDSFETVLEPEHTERWRGPEVGRGLVAVAKRLEANGFTPEIIGPSNASMRSAINYFDEMTRQPEVLHCLDTFAYHRYGIQMDSMVQEIRSRAARNDLKTGMLEKVGAGVDVLLDDLILGQVSSWQQWAVAGRRTDKDRGAYYVRVGMDDSALPRVSFSKSSRQLSQVFKYVRRGAVRMKATSDNYDKTSIAFINREGDWVVVIRAKKAGGPIRVLGLPEGMYGLSFVDDQGSFEQSPTVSLAAGDVLNQDLPRPGVLTIYALRERTGS